MEQTPQTLGKIATFGCAAVLMVALLGAAPGGSTSAHTAEHGEHDRLSATGPVQSYSAANGFFCRYVDEF